MVQTGECVQTNGRTDGQTHTHTWLLPNVIISPAMRSIINWLLKEGHSTVIIGSLIAVRETTTGIQYCSFDHPCDILSDTEISCTTVLSARPFWKVLAG